MGEFDYVTEVLGNGLRFIRLDLPRAQSAFLGAFLRGGPAYEEPNHAGVSHLLEHLHLRTTLRHPNPSDLWQDLDDCTTLAYGCTWPDTVGFLMLLPPESVGSAGQLLSDILAIRPLSNDEIDREKCILNSESVVYDGGWLKHAMAVVHAGCSLGYSQSEVRTRLKNLDRPTIEEYQRDLFCPSTTTAVLVGNIGAGPLGDVRTALAGLRRTAGSARVQTIQRAAIRKRVRPWNASHGFASIFLAFCLEAELTPRELEALQILANTFNLFSSPARVELFDAPTHVYFCQGEAQSIDRHHLLAFSLQCPLKAQDRALRIALSTCRGLRDNPMDVGWMNRCRQRQLGSVRRYADDPFAVGTMIGQGDVCANGRVNSILNEVLEANKTMTADEVLGVARRILREENLLLWYGARSRWFRQRHIRRIIHDELG